MYDWNGNGSEDPGGFLEYLRLKIVIGDEYMSVLKELFGDRIGAASVVTHDVGDYEVAVGSPARVIKTLDHFEGILI